MKRTGSFFDTISWAPIDIDLIDISLLVGRYTKSQLRGGLPAKL